ncbi:GNAT family N-acetyltransferase [Frigoribacterium sp. 2-23]|uniref:GNAT family N-acetyltransferase n=1 Tax=Frigoribacterium sp. 2-23 TaxID=3415006 RepID=UPI003C6F2778
MTTTSTTASSAPPALHVERIDYDDPRAVALRDAMGVEMNERYGDPLERQEPVEITRAREAALAIDPAHVHASVLVVDDAGQAFGHAVLHDRRGEWEVKRVIVDGSQRGRGVGRLLMEALEDIAREGGAHRLVLQTGDRQPDAVALYEKIGYTRIPVYEPYVTTIPQSLCYEKPIDGSAATGLTVA